MSDAKRRKMRRAVCIAMQVALGQLGCSNAERHDAGPGPTAGGGLPATGGQIATSGAESGGSMAAGNATGGSAAGIETLGGGSSVTGGATSSGGSAAAGAATAGAGAGAGASAGSGAGGTSGGVPGAGGDEPGGSDGASAGSSGDDRVLDPTSLAVRLANAVIARWPDPNDIGGSSAWDYNHGIVLRGIEQVYRHTSDARYLAYIQKYADRYVSASGVVSIPAAHSFDNIEPSVLLPFLFEQTGLARYRTGADQIRARYDSIPRNADRGFWHKQTYPNQMWLDSIYMGQPFLMRYGKVFGTCGAFCSDTVVEQLTLITAHVRDPATGLPYHAWDDSPAPKASWANAQTGRSSVVWGRAVGWYAMALVDLLQDLPASHTGRAALLSYLVDLAAALKTTQDPTSGLWFQVLDEGAKSDDWLETSSSGMFVYALKVATDLGYVDPSYMSVANDGWRGLTAKITSDAQGVPSITGAVHGMVVQNDYAGYIAQLPTLSNSPHGLCAALLAASEMEAH